MATMNISVENIKCGGCAATITDAMKALPGVSNVNVNVEQGVVSLDGSDVDRAAAVKKLHGLGYPEQGTSHGLDSAVSTAKSFVSCAIGRVKS